MFDRAQLETIADLCQEFDALAITDEIYEHIIYDGAQHIPMMTIPGMRDRTILINSMSKTYSVTGWRVGWVLASPDLTESVRKVPRFSHRGRSCPACRRRAWSRLACRTSTIRSSPSTTTERRDPCWQCWNGPASAATFPRGAYYVMADISGIGLGDDLAAVAPSDWKQ